MANKEQKRKDDKGKPKLSTKEKRAKKLEKQQLREKD